MNQLSKDKIKRIIGDCIVGMIHKEISLDKQAKLIDEKQIELDELNATYKQSMDKQEQEFESLIELMKLLDNFPIYLNIENLRAYFNYHPDSTTVEAADLVMKKVSNELGEKAQHI
jgi:hypothetical protein